MAAKSNTAQADDRTLVIVRVFDAPVNLVWQAWTQDEHLRKWSAPRGYAMVSSEGDLRAGGTWRACMRAPDGSELWLGGVYRELVENRLLVMTHYWDEENGRPGPETLVTVRFEDLGGRTRMTFEQAGFDSVPSRDGHAEGWNECFDILAAHLATLRR
ncbi:MAG: SRPBCC domain-containing protein [Proteobacteria bacterium]|nr:SRPBCC domain-containing protein [Pseudomonadota bacterium]